MINDKLIWVVAVFIVVFVFADKGRLHCKISENNWNGLKRRDNGLKNGLKWNFHC